jgi:hypothetical protein
MVSRMPRAQPSPLELEVLRLEPGIFAYCGWRNFSIGVWVGQATLPAVNGMLRMSEDLEQRFPHGRSSVIFVADKVPAPTPEAREAFARVYTPKLSCTAMVLEGDGFWASGIRSMSANVHRSADTPALLRVHNDIEQVVAWLPQQHLAHTGVNVSAEELARVLRSARAEAEVLARDAR